ncbi:MAG TPA: methyltransferase domain-containing protein, partial [Solirubrobacteraceae bacterium]|nr:methyltransferase domain-containing protein [Solirubrobacteraceae bacterium]
MLLELAPPSDGERVLDAGCGDGNVALELAERGAVVTACDLSPTLLAAARRRAAAAGAQIDWREGDLEALPFADASFDATWSALAPAFCARPHRALAELMRVTRPGGRIALALWT